MPSIESVDAVLAGTAGGISVTVFGHGFDTVKVKMQSSQTNSSFVNAVKSIYREAGVGGFYAGIGSPLAGSMVFCAVLFLAHKEISEFTIHVLGMQPDTFRQSLLSGAMCGVVASGVENVVDFFKTQKQVAMNNKTKFAHENVFVLGRKLVREHGWFVSYQGFSATLIRNIPANAVYFASFEEMLKRNPLQTQSDALNAMFAGAVGGWNYWFFTYPLDVIKTKMMAQDPSICRTKKLTWVGAATELYREAGFRSFTRGLTPCLIRAIPANGICLTTVDGCKRWFKERRQNAEKAAKQF